MKKIFLVLLVSLMAISLVFAAQGSTGTAGTTGAGKNAPTTTDSDTAAQAGQGTGNGTQTNTELQTKNQGENIRLQNQVRVQTGSYMNQAGEQMQIQSGAGNEIKMQVKGVEAKSNLQIGSELDPIQNRTRLRINLSNGKNAEIKVMPNTASERALERLRLKVCNSENNCTIELKEVGSGEKIRAVYEVKARKEAKFLWMFKTKMQVRAQIDAETGEVIQAKKPWWSFLTSEI
ncbi:MAG: hypothetical protein QXW97_04430 [Candidatus Pacearchaeota archaeon]